jgi:hypothetical protein
MALPTVREVSYTDTFRIEPALVNSDRSGGIATTIKENMNASMGGLKTDFETS